MEFLGTQIISHFPKKDFENQRAYISSVSRSSYMVDFRHIALGLLPRYWKMGRKIMNNVNDVHVYCRIGRDFSKLVLEFNVFGLDDFSSLSQEESKIGDLDMMPPWEYDTLIGPHDYKIGCKVIKQCLTS